MTQGKRIRAIRQLRGYSQKELGIRAGMSPKSAGSRIARYEDGRCVPRKETLFRIARALNVSPMAVAPYTGRDPREILEILFWLEEAGKMDGIMEVRDLMAMMDVWEVKKDQRDRGEISEGEYLEWKLRCFCGRNWEAEG